MRLLPLCILSLALVGSLAGCVPPNLHDTPGLPTRPPDAQFAHEAGTHMDYVVVWTCVDGEHVIATNTCGSFCGRAWTVERVACGQLILPYDTIPSDARQAMPGGRGW